MKEKLARQMAIRITQNRQLSADPHSEHFPQMSRAGHYIYRPSSQVCNKITKKYGEL
jgi:hypothetical protein